ncbi:hypothetical protein [Phascolarctobacterium sp.]
MSDPIMNITGNRMFQLKQDIAALRECLAACTDEDSRKKIRSEIMEKETYYNILADRQRLGQ